MLANRLKLMNGMIILSLLLVSIGLAASDKHESIKNVVLFDNDEEQILDLVADFSKLEISPMHGSQKGSGEMRQDTDVVLQIEKQTENDFTMKVRRSDLLMQLQSRAWTTAKARELLGLSQKNTK